MATDPSLFRIVQREPGQTSADLPIFAATPESASTLLDDHGADQCQQKQQQEQKKKPPSVVVEEFRDGVVLLHNVLTKAECRRIKELSDAMGYTDDAPVSLGRNIRQNESCVWLMDEAVNRKIFDRVQSVLPAIDLATGTTIHPTGLNHRWRLYKYNPSDVFKLHSDGAWTDSGLDEDGHYVQDLYDGKALSFQTFLIYLNDDFDGGATTFPVEHPNKLAGEPSSFEVQPREGSVLCFYHGHHPLSRLHEGSVVHSGTKYVARTDVLYELPLELQQQQH